MHIEKLTFIIAVICLCSILVCWAWISIIKHRVVKRMDNDWKKAWEAKHKTPLSSCEKYWKDSLEKINFFYKVIFIFFLLSIILVIFPLFMLLINLLVSISTVTNLVEELSPLLLFFIMGMILIGTSLIYLILAKHLFTVYTEKIQDLCNETSS